MFSPDWFIQEQITGSKTDLEFSDSARLVALQLGNAYLLLCMLGVAVLMSTSELRVVKAYLLALWVADIGHLGLTYMMLGYARFTNVSNWNAMTWGNVAATVRSHSFLLFSNILIRWPRGGSTDVGFYAQAFLCLTRSAYFLGLFGQDCIYSVAKKSQ